MRCMQPRETNKIGWWFWHNRVSVLNKTKNTENLPEQWCSYLQGYCSGEVKKKTKYFLFLFLLHSYIIAKYRDISVTTIWTNAILNSEFLLPKIWFIEIKFLELKLFQLNRKLKKIRIKMKMNSDSV